MAKHRAPMRKPVQHRRVGNQPLQHSPAVPPFEPVPLEKLPLDVAVTPVPSKAHLGSKS